MDQGAANVDSERSAGVFISFELMVERVSLARSSVLGASVHLGENTGVGVYDDNEGKPVHHDHPEQRVGNFVGEARKRVERHALLVPREFRMALHVKDYDLQQQHNNQTTIAEPV